MSLAVFSVRRSLDPLRSARFLSAFIIDLSCIDVLWLSESQLGKTRPITSTLVPPVDHRVSLVANTVQLGCDQSIRE